MVRAPPKRALGRVPANLLPKRAHQWGMIDSVKPEIYHQCVVCFKGKPEGYNNYNECPGYPDLFLHFKEDPYLITKEGKERKHVQETSSEKDQEPNEEGSED